MHVRSKVLAALFGLVLLITACSSGHSCSSSGGPAAVTPGRCPYTFAVITHGDNGSFWSLTYKGAKDRRTPASTRS